MDHVKSRQLILDLARDPLFDADDFLVAPSNAEAHRLIEFWPDWPEPMLILCGPAGAGKSHLATVWARKAGARIVRADEALDPEGLAREPALLLEDCDRAGRPEAPLFHLLNLVRERRISLMVTARRRPDQWGLVTPDLLSRLRLSPLVELGPPSAELMRLVLVKLFADRQIRVDEDVIFYATLHLDQSLGAARRFVKAVDEAALAAGRRITRPLAAATIAWLEDIDACDDEVRDDPDDQGPT